MTHQERRQFRFKDKLFFIFLSAVLGVGGFFGSRLYGSIDELKKEKLDASTYFQDMKELETRQKERFDMIIKLLEQHREETRRHNRDGR